MFSSPMTENLNFQTLFNSLVSLFVMKTGNNFYELSNAAMREHSIVF